MCIGKKSILDVDVHEENQNFADFNGNNSKSFEWGKTLLLSQDQTSIALLVYTNGQIERFQHNNNNNDAIQFKRQCCNRIVERNMQKGNAAFYSAEMSPNLTDHYVRFDPPFFVVVRMKSENVLNFTFN